MSAGFVGQLHRHIGIKFSYLVCALAWHSCKCTSSQQTFGSGYAAMCDNAVYKVISGYSCIKTTSGTACYTECALIYLSFGQYRSTEPVP